MQTAAWKEFKLSRLLLGTVQFGMPYGIANRTGQPTYEDVLAMLKAAIDAGVNCLDTAAVYGSSEEVLGRAIAELGIKDRVVVITKVAPLKPEEREHPDRAAKAITESVGGSRARLGIDCLPLVLFHRPEDAVYSYVLEELRSKGWLRHIGVSCLIDPAAPLGLVESGNIGAMQLPGNLLGRQHETSGVFKKASDKGIAVFIRSVYLQGLLVMPEESIPPVLRDVIPARRRLEAVAKEAGMGMAALALRYMLSQEGVTSVLIGVETVAQVRENLELFSRGPLTRDVVAAAREAAGTLPELVINPNLWPK